MGVDSTVSQHEIGSASRGLPHDCTTGCETDGSFYSTTQDTRPGDLQLTHAASPFNETRRRVRVNRYWNEEFLIVIQHNINHSFNDIFVWKWKECQNPQFLYSHDLLPLYPTGKNVVLEMWKNMN